jgi:hypothetical protein
MKSMSGLLEFGYDSVQDTIICLLNGGADHS